MVAALLLCGVAVLSAGFGDSLYKWVDERGNVHYSDKPHPGATRLHLPKPTTYAAPAVAAPNTPSSAPPPQQGYSLFQISEPEQDQVFWNVRDVTVVVSVQPGLQPGDQVTITLDDKTVGPSPSTTATFNDLDRGEHTVRATLSGPGGSMSAKPVTFYIQQATKHMH